MHSRRVVTGCDCVPSPVIPIVPRLLPTPPCRRFSNSHITKTQRLTPGNSPLHSTGSALPGAATALLHRGAEAGRGAGERQGPHQGRGRVHQDAPRERRRLPCDDARRMGREYRAGARALRAPEPAGVHGHRHRSDVAVSVAIETPRPHPPGADPERQKFIGPADV